MGCLIVLYIIVAVVAIVQAALILLQAYENARYFRKRLRNVPNLTSSLHVQLFVPCKGVEPGFDKMVAAVLNQDYPSYRVTFVVESKGDPAWARLQALLSEPPGVRAQVVVAGQAVDCGQKVHNLLAVTAKLDREVEVLAFMDSDIQPPADWLRRLLGQIQKKGIGAVTGYRWFLTKTDNSASVALSALNAAATGLLGNHRWNPIWGGSWVILCKTFEAAGVRQAWQGVLSDDYAAWKAVKRTGMPVVFEPGGLAASPVQTTWGNLLEFGRRQYSITFCYAPGLWLLVLSGGLLSCTAFWGGLGLWLGTWLAGHPVWWLGLPALGLYLLGAARAWFRQSSAAARFPEQRQALRRSSHCDIFLHPLLNLINLGLVLSSAGNRLISWRGIRYRVKDSTRLEILFRATASPALDQRKQAA